MLSDLPDDEMKADLISLFADIEDAALREAIAGTMGEERTSNRQEDEE
jgi:hypothetical protein